jgi:hypothetical protein
LTLASEASATAFTIISVSYSVLLNFSPSPTWNLKLPSLSVSLFGTNSTFPAPT